MANNKMGQQNFMLDTNVFNNIIKNEKNINDFKKYSTIKNINFYATCLQLNEIKEVKDLDKKDTLLKIFKEILKKSDFPVSFMYDVPGAGWNQGRMGVSGDLCHQIKEKMSSNLKIKDKNDKTGKKYKYNRTQRAKQSQHCHSFDANIAKASIHNKHTLVTDDKLLYDTIKEDFNAKCITYQKLQEICIKYI